MKKLKFSIIIPCSTDIRIKDCIQSIDENVEIVVVLNGASKAVKKIVKGRKVRCLNLKKPNLSKALNYGIKRSIYSKVLFIDSDCKFEKGSIRKIYTALQNNLMVKGKVVFRYDNLISKIIAETRDYVNYNNPRPYNPFLAIDKKIKKYSDGYYFDDKIHWTEDADFYARLKKSNLKVKYLFSVKAFHPPLTLFQDLRSAFRYGIGKRIRIENKKTKGLGTHFLNIPDLIDKKGFFCGIYYFVWNFFYLLGYFYQIIGDPYRVRSN